MSWHTNSKFLRGPEPSKHLCCRSCGCAAVPFCTLLQCAAQRKWWCGRFPSRTLDALIESGNVLDPSRSVALRWVVEKHARYSCTTRFRGTMVQTAVGHRQYIRHGDVPMSLTSTRDRMGDTSAPLLSPSQHTVFDQLGSRGYYGDGVLHHHHRLPSSITPSFYSLIDLTQIGERMLMTKFQRWKAHQIPGLRGESCHWRLTKSLHHTYQLFPFYDCL